MIFFIRWRKGLKFQVSSVRSFPQCFESERVGKTVDIGRLLQCGIKHFLRIYDLEYNNDFRIETKTIEEMNQYKTVHEFEHHNGHYTTRQQKNIIDNDDKYM